MSKLPELDQPIEDLCLDIIWSQGRDIQVDCSVDTMLH